MNRVFRINTFSRVPDGTLVSPFLNPKDNKSGLPFELHDGFSLAAGIIEAKSKSQIHVMPLVAQVTFVLSGKLTVKMKSIEDNVPYSLSLRSGEAVLTKAGTLFQLTNEEASPCEVLYIVSPPYLHEESEGKVLYDDSLVLQEDWMQLANSHWRILREPPTLEKREDAKRRLAAGAP
jgi:mannose-6-phosphate isomerase-like protein (cupin superfamily)